jgi:hypothetical protein
MSLTRLSLGGNNLYMTSLFPPRESLVSDIPAGDGNIEKPLFTVYGDSPFYSPSHVITWALPTWRLITLDLLGRGGKGACR